TAICRSAPITSCANGDGCCAPGCDATSDDDCSATCGNGIVEPMETCDGDCPASCDDGVACTTDALVGSAASCSASCSHTAVTSCGSGDGCCAPGCTSANDDDCAPACVDPPPPPRLVAPLSTSRVTRGDATFRWELAPGTTGAEVEVCADRACTSVVATFSVTGSSGAPATPLAPGNYYWRARGRCEALTGTGTSPIWQVSVARGARGAHTTWTYAYDVNGDFRADAIIRERSSSLGGPVLHHYEGRATGLLEVRTEELGVGELDLAGDVNGDGYGDALVAFSGTRVYLGGPAGLEATHAARITGSVQDLAGLGDVDGDGYGDFATVRTSTSSTLYFYRGGGTISTTAHQSFVVAAGLRGGVDAAGDVNGDGYADALVTNCFQALSGCEGDVFVYLGGPSGLGTTPAWSVLSSDDIVAAGGGDLDGDGYSDVVVSDYTTISVYYGGASGLSATPGRTRTEPASM
ncbi:MAG: VCBS repeat-containing protein, partial [Sandaracinaceae bacterium]|nr:VCBS repeat-containing protein [Sandaracinaceae bacterium]